MVTGMRGVLIALLFITLNLFVILKYLRLGGPIFRFATPSFFSGNPSKFFSTVVLCMCSAGKCSYVVGCNGRTGRTRGSVPGTLLCYVPALVIVCNNITVMTDNILPLSRMTKRPLALITGGVLGPTLFAMFVVNNPMLTLSSSVGSAVSGGYVPITRSYGSK